MKKFAIILLLLMANLAHAYDVTVDTSERDINADPTRGRGLIVYQDPDRVLRIWGRVDSAYMNISHVGTADKSAGVFLNAGEKTPIIGFKFYQNLEDNWTTGLRFDAQVMTSDGSTGNGASSGTDNKIWAQYAYWWIYNPDYGRLTVGRQDGVEYTAMKYADARPGYNFGSALTYYTDGSYFGGSATAKTGMTSLDGSNQVSSSFRYDSPKFHDVSFAYHYIPGNTAGSMDYSSRQAWGMFYRPKTGWDQGLSLAYGENVIHNATGQLVGRSSTYGGNYQFDDKKALVAAGYTQWSNPSLAENVTYSKYHMWQTSAKYFITPRFDISGGRYALYDDGVKDNKSTQYVVGVEYYLSKSIMVYANWAKIDNQGNMGFAPYGPGSGSLNSLSTYYPQATVKIPGQDITATMVGFSIEF